MWQLLAIDKEPRYSVLGMWWTLVPLLGHFFLMDASAAGFCARLLAPLRLDQWIAKDVRRRAYPALRYKIREYDAELEKSARDGRYSGLSLDEARLAAQEQGLAELGYDSSVAERLLIERPDLARRILMRRWKACTAYRGIAASRADFRRSTGSTFWVYVGDERSTLEFAPPRGSGEDLRVVVELTLPGAVLSAPAFRMVAGRGNDEGQSMWERFSKERKINPRITTDQFLFASRVRRILDGGTLGEWSDVDSFLKSLAPEVPIPEVLPIQEQDLQPLRSTG